MFRPKLGRLVTEPFITYILHKQASLRWALPDAEQSFDLEPKRLKGTKILPTV
jgi:hypothetical protein